ncbi:MAG: histone deacetylase [Bacillota bacterium]|nr:histone deacetylase [Bacillota bacterium]
MKQTGVIFFPAFDWAISPTHPEREERLLYTRDQIFEEGIMDLPQIAELKPRMAEPKDIARVHFCVPNVEAQATDAHLVAAGSALRIADAVMQKEVVNGFAIVRPPGHHAKTVAHGNRGFCNINNEAIMVEYLRKNYGLRKIAIVDTDVHHGDGTQDIFFNDPDTLFISFHQDGRTLYPGTGFIEEAGGPLAAGTTINIPLPPETTDVGIHYVLDHLVMPMLEEFQPDLVINSAGQDNHYSDPLANMNFSAQGYARLNTKLNPDIAVLEGGYSVETALPYVNMGILMAMADIDYSNLREPDYHQQHFKESEKNLTYIQRLVEKQLELFRGRQALIKRNREKHRDVFTESERIFYDTDYIDERQNKRLTMCAECSGLRTIDSTAHHQNGMVNRVFCISIPMHACPGCLDAGKEAYASMCKMGQMYEYIYLQNKFNDEYRSFHVKTETEKVL